MNRDITSGAMSNVRTRLVGLQCTVVEWLAGHSIVLLRLSLGLIFLGFGALKFIPGASPAEGLAERTMEALTLGLIPGGVGLVLVAVLETTIGLSLTTGRYQRLGLALLGLAMVGVLAPLVLFAGELFPRPYRPTLAGQYVMKDIVLLAASLVVAVGGWGGRIVPAREPRHDDSDVASPRQPHRPTWTARRIPRTELARVRVVGPR